MDIKRMYSILNNDNKNEVFYDNRSVWIQSIDNNNEIAKVGFIDDFTEKDVYIKDLYERNL